MIGNEADFKPMKKFNYLVLLVILTVSCNTMKQDRVMYSGSLDLVESIPLMNDYGKTILERFDPPMGYVRVNLQNQTFGEYLRTLSLKPEGAPARFYNGKTKPNNNVYVSVVDLPISKKDLQSSSDAIIRLKSEFLFNQKKYDQIKFHNNTEAISFVDYSKGDFSREKFNHYLDYVMEKVTTPSFCKDLKPVKIKDLQVGDVFVQNTNPNGHAVIVVDLVKNSDGEKLFLLAQSFQPAQEIQIITNPARDDISPWYQAKEGELLTPEWRFMTSDLMRFKDLEN